ncbi:uncharacterized protein LOC124133952 isoform X2 [Haliotis rufescens]|uniref:uncharacterized protein LOC124133952 isoform X2 n=1 Tax=Haliotis rufescens TaxID=6454 RepID=UPI00201E8AA9|nr:uncharacterized protein LOC124133952 isoform X2 [Haliotis rufescens]
MVGTAKNRAGAMEACILFVLAAVIGQSLCQLQNQPINGQVGNQNGNYLNVNGGNAGNQGNQWNNAPRLQGQQQQQNLVKQFNQNVDQFAQQNLAGAAARPQNNNNNNRNFNNINNQLPINTGVIGAQVAGNNPNLGNVPNVASNQNQFNAGQGVQGNNAPGALGSVVQPGSSNIQARVQNEAHVNQPQAVVNGAQGQQVNQPNQFNQQNQANQPNQVNQLNAGNQGNQANQPAQGNSQVREEVNVPAVQTEAPHVQQDTGAGQGQSDRRADTIAEDDRQRSARLERPVETINDNNQNGVNGDQRGVIKNVADGVNQNNNPQPNTFNANNNAGGAGYQNFNGGGVNMNDQGRNYQHQQREIGGIRLTWDWSDFAITFDDYGGAEMKVRRAPHSTTGEPWPLPQYYVKKEKRVYKLDKDLFTFKVIGETCDIIQEAVERYRTRVLEDAVEDMYDNLQNAPGTNIDDPALKYDKDMYTKAHVIAKVDIKIRKPCQKFPSVDSDESYDLVVKKARAFIWANEVWGALRGLETFSHIVWRGLDGEDPDDRAKNANLFVKETVISDYPRFPHRGILVDSSRHFFFKETIFDILDGMEQNKMNVLHWHIIDDQSFPYQSEVFPELSRKGAFHPTFVYTQKDIAEIIDYARFRGIRVMPEFDTPGHTYSWGLSRPDLLTQCYQGGSPVKGYLGPIDPTKNSTYKFLRTLFAEVLDTFKDQYIHLGGDEVPLGCWQSNPDVVNFGMELSKQQPEGSQSTYNGYYSSQFDVRKVYEYYENRIMKDLREIGKHRKDGVKFVMWQEVMNNDLQLPNDTIIEVWMGDMADVNRAISMGYQVVYATCWYLDHVEYGTKWPKYYQCDPADNTFGYMIDEKKVLGGEACLWSEYIDNENMMTTLWPRASAVAERLWSAKDVRDLDTAGARLSEHRCRMLNRGLSVAQISGPDYCLKRGIGRSRDKYRTNSTCTSGRCVKSRDGTFVEMDDIEVRQPHRHMKVPECPKVPAQGGLLIFLGTALIILIAVGVGVKSTTGRLAQARICKNRTILILFISVLLIYFMCYTSIWMQVFDFSGSFHKRQDSDLTNDKH